MVYDQSYNTAPAWAKFAMERFGMFSEKASYHDFRNQAWVHSSKGSIVLDKETNTLTGHHLCGSMIHPGSEISFEAIAGIIRALLLIR